MNQQDSLEQLYKEALSSSASPGCALDKQLKQQMEEHIPVKKTRHFILRPMMAAALVALMSITVLAAWNLLSPADAADFLDAPAVARAFRSDDAIIINKTQSQNGYDVSFLGIVSGKGLTALENTIDEAKTYAVVAIAKQDGSMPAVSDADYDSTPFFVSPLIHGQLPWQYNIASMGGGYHSNVVDGVMYRLIECDSIEIFAHRGLSLIVSSTSFYSIEAFDYDSATGLISPKSGFSGVNLVFDLPLDERRGNDVLAQQYLDSLWDQEDTPGPEPTGMDAGGASVFLSETAEGGIGISTNPVENGNMLLTD